MADPIVVDSSWVLWIGYDGGILSIRTKKQKLIQFVVPPSIWGLLQSAPSKGEFINKHIKGKFKEL